MLAHSAPALQDLFLNTQRLELESKNGAYSLHPLINGSGHAFNPAADAARSESEFESADVAALSQYLNSSVDAVHVSEQEETGAAIIIFKVELGNDPSVRLNGVGRRNCPLFCSPCLINSLIVTVPVPFGGPIK